MEDLLEKRSHFTISKRETMGFILQRDHQLGEFIMAAQSHGVQSQLSSSVREGEGGSVEVWHYRTLMERHYRPLKAIKRVRRRKTIAWKWQTRYNQFRESNIF